MTQIPIETIKKFAKDHLNEGNDRAFCERVWSTDVSVYQKRLGAINFTNKENILDAGFGLGQWMYAMAQSNKHVTGIEFDKKRFSFTKDLFQNISADNVQIHHGSVENLPFEDNTFDAIFSYSVILCADYRKALNEFYRVLKPGGKLYFNTNGLGWYLFNLFEGHNNASNFSSQTMAINALEATIKYFAEGVTSPGACVVTPKEIVLNDLKTIGFRNILVDSEGCIKLNSADEVRPFFKGEYNGYEGVTEYLCEK